MQHTSYTDPQLISMIAFMGSAAVSVAISYICMYHKMTWESFVAVLLAALFGYGAFSVTIWSAPMLLPGNPVPWGFASMTVIGLLVNLWMMLRRIIPSLGQLGHRREA